LKGGRLFPVCHREERSDVAIQLNHANHEPAAFLRARNFVLVLRDNLPFSDRL
jgi:hypothetical protein